MKRIFLNMKIYQIYGKRVFDLSAALLGIVFLSPFFLFIAFLIKFEDQGPVFFIQKRIGKNGKLFDIYKFRSMSYNPWINNFFTPGDKSRITKIGKFLRKYKIDELPELMNIIKGEMSFVGPRPEVIPYFDFYRKEPFNDILYLRPGITDWASIKYRSEEELLGRAKNPDKLYREKILPKKLNLNLLYSRNIRLKTDLKIIFITLFKVVAPGVNSYQWGIEG